MGCAVNVGNAERIHLPLRVERGGVCREVHGGAVVLRSVAAGCGVPAAKGVARAGGRG